MAENSKIEWTTHTANLWHGCTHVHAGCDNCYAETLSHRWGNDVWGVDKPRKVVESVWKDLDRFQKLAASAGEMHRVFVGSMMDIFEKPVKIIDNTGFEIVSLDTIVGHIGSEENNGNMMTGHLRDKFFQLISEGRYPNLMFLLLTKRPSNINKYIPEQWKTNPPANVMFGTSVVNQETADTLIPQLLKVNGKRFLSMEPLLGSVDLNNYLFMTALNMSPAYLEPSGCINWIIVGGESGHKARPMHPQWALSLRDQCASAGVPFLFKQWGEWVADTQHENFIAGKEVRSVINMLIDGSEYKEGYIKSGDLACMKKVGKKAAGNHLDGKQYLEFPKI